MKINATNRDTKKLQEQLNEFHEQVAEAEETIANLKLQVQEAKSIVSDLLDAKVEKSFSEIASFNRNLQKTLLREVFNFLKVAPVWEVIQIKETGVLRDYQTMKEWYAKGYTMMGYSYNPQTANIVGTLLHRPAPPKTFTEFQQLYNCFVKGEPMNPKTVPNEHTVTIVAKPKPKSRKRKTN